MMGLIARRACHTTTDNSGKAYVALAPDGEISCVSAPFDDAGESAQAGCDH